MTKSHLLICDFLTVKEHLFFKGGDDAWFLIVLSPEVEKSRTAATIFSDFFIFFQFHELHEFMCEYEHLL
jgi:hypothetical protein